MAARRRPGLSLLDGCMGWGSFGAALGLAERGLGVVAGLRIENRTLTALFGVSGCAPTGAIGNNIIGAAAFYALARFRSG